MTDKDLGTAAGDIFAKAFTLGYETGRNYIPAGGMALTAEQVEDVKIVLGQLERGGPAFEAAHERLRALFPATEPAEDAKPCGSNSVTLGWCKLTARHEGLHTNGTYLWGTPSEPDPPAPAEPAEEETKAEDDRPFDLNVLVDQVTQAGWRERERAEGFRGIPSIDWDTQLDWQKHIEYEVVRGILAELKRLGLFSTPTSSPVVPAPTETGPTETGPWPTWDDVPSGIKYRESPRRGWGTWWWINRNGIRRLADFCGEEVATTIAIPVGPFEAVYQS